MKKWLRLIIPYVFLVIIRRLIQKKPLFIKYRKIYRDDVGKHLCNLNITIDKENILKINHGDYKYPMYIRNDTSDVYVYKSIIEKNNYAFSCKIEPKFIVDAGANIGMSAIYFANKYKYAKIIAIEPEEENFELLKNNTEKYPNIIVIRAALWNVSGEIGIFDTGLDNWGFMTGTSDLKIEANKKHFTNAVTVDEIMKKYNFATIDVLKIDIEGAEKEVFDSSKNWIDKVNLIIIELHERMKKGCNASFYKNIKTFDQIGRHGENIYLSKNNYIKMI